MIDNKLLSTSISPVQKLRVALLFMLLLITGGTLGFVAIEDMTLLNALYMTIITISTVGFGEVTPLHDYGKILAISIITVGFFVAAGIITFLGQMTMEIQFKDLVTRRKMENKLKKMTNHYIIAGYGRVGRHVAHEFKKKRVPFIVIEEANESIQRIIEDGYMFVQGDATAEEVLTKALINDAHTLVSTLPKEALNVYLTLTARDMNKNLNIIARADYEDGEKKLRRAGADHVIIPHVLGGIRMAKAALQPNVVAFMEMTALGEEGLLVEELLVPELASLAGRTLLESNLKKEYGITIIGIKQNKAKMKINPGPETKINAGDVLVLLGETGKLERLSSDLHLEKHVS